MTHSTIDQHAVTQLRLAAERAVSVLQALPPLVAHGLNEIWSSEDGCCPSCCGPCSALASLARSGLLDDAVRPFVTETNGAGYEWWTGTSVDGHVKRWALRKRWAQCPNHDDDHERRMANADREARDTQAALDVALTDGEATS